jgi:peptidoglycan biosynthesis protein MviN/MurJ (putative lipid II flippase)
LLSKQARILSKTVIIDHFPPGGNIWAYLGLNASMAKSALTTTALLGYAVGLPGLTAEGLLILSFYALKDARTPLLTNIAALATRIGLIVLLLQMLTGKYGILAIPLAASMTSTAQAALLCLLLLIRLRTKVKTDKGMQRLQRRWKT